MQSGYAGLLSSTDPGVLRSLQPPPMSLPGSDRDLSADFDHATRRNLEIIGRVIGDTGEQDEQPILPARHAGMHSRLERYMKEMETSLRSLSAGQRESDLAEMRQHLVSIIEAHKELAKGKW